MHLGKLIEILEKEENRVVPLGFRNPHSYRGSYDCLAFVPARDVEIWEMVECAKSAIGETYTGWKGGDYTMAEWTDCYLAEVGCSGEQLGYILLNFILGKDPLEGVVE